MHVVFICTGNICRSPTAERLSVAYARTHGVDELTASSAGTRAVVDYPMHEIAASVLKQLGGSPSGFCARQVTPGILQHADLIITMTRAHRNCILELAPQRFKRTFTLGEASRLASDFGAQTVGDLSAMRSLLPVGDYLDVADPIGRDPEFFECVGTRIARLLPPVLGLLRDTPNPH